MQARPTGGAGEARGGDRHRLFFALWPDAAVRDGIAAAAAALRRAHGPRGRWIGRHRYHLTLQFLGDADHLGEDVASAAKDAAAGVLESAFDLVLDTAGSFRNRSVPWWLGCASPPEGLRGLWTSLGSALRDAGVSVAADKALVPHVTVLRDAHPALPQVAIAPVHWPVREFVLVHSVLGARSAYHLLGRWPLPPSQGRVRARA